MGWQVLTDDSGRYSYSVLTCNTTDVAFGPVMFDTTREKAEAFVTSLPIDPRLMTHAELEAAWHGWMMANEL